MQSLVARYRQAVTSAQKLKQSRAQSQKNAKISPKKELTMQQLETDKQKQTQIKQSKFNKELKQKKSVSKISKNTKSHQKVSKKRQTPKKNKPIVTQASLGDLYSEAIFDLFPKNSNFTEDIKAKIKILLEEYFNKRMELPQQNNILSKLQQSGFYIIPSQAGTTHPNLGLLSQSHMNGGSLTNLTSASKANNSQMAKGFNMQLQRKFFQCEKQRHHYKMKHDALVKRYENIDAEIERYIKMERLIDNTIERENQMRKQVNRLRKDLQLCELKNIQQQKVYRKQIMRIYEIMEELKTGLQKK